MEVELFGIEQTNGEQARKAAGAGWRVRAALADCEVETGAQPGNAREVLIDGKPAPQVALGRLARVIWLVPAMDRLWTDAPDARRRFLDRLSLSFLPGHAEAALAYDKAMRERNRLLRGVGVIRACVDLQLAGDGAAELVLREHADDGLLHEAVGGPLEDLADGAGPQATRVSGVVVQELAVALVAADRDLVGVDDDDEVAAVNVRRKGRLVLAAQQGSHVGGQTAQDDVSRVDDVPGVLEVTGLRGVRTHGRSLRFVSCVITGTRESASGEVGEGFTKT